MGTQTKKEAASAMFTIPRGRNRGAEANIRRKGQVPTVSELQAAIRGHKDGVTVRMYPGGAWTASSKPIGDDEALRPNYYASLQSFSCSTRAAKELLVQLRAAIAAEVSDD